MCTRKTRSMAALIALLPLVVARDSALGFPERDILALLDGKS